MIAQRRLATWNLSTKSPDYNQLDANPQATGWRQRYHQIKSDPDSEPITEANPIITPPSPVSLFEGYCLLKALNDPILTPITLKDIADQLSVRNNMLMEHGFEKVTQRQFNVFRELVNRLIQTLFSIEQWDLKNTLAIVRFPEQLPPLS